MAVGVRERKQEVRNAVIRALYRVWSTGTDLGEALDIGKDVGATEAEIWPALTYLDARGLVKRWGQFNARITPAGVDMAEESGLVEEAERGTNGAIRLSLLRAFWDADATSERGRPYTSWDEVANATGIDVEQVRRHLDWLEYVGWIDRTGGRMVVLTADGEDEGDKLFG